MLGPGAACSGRLHLPSQRRKPRTEGRGSGKQPGLRPSPTVPTEGLSWARSSHPPAAPPVPCSGHPVSLAGCRTSFLFPKHFSSAYSCISYNTHPPLARSTSPSEHPPNELLWKLQTPSQVTSNPFSYRPPSF